MMTPKNQTTPMLKQYLEVKEKYQDCILFYRMGDFYEMFFEDAVQAAPLLEVQLTSRDKSAENPIPMCGIPFHAASHYVEKLLAHGRKVALCEQLEDPRTVKGIVKRDVVRVVTPSLVADPELVPEHSTNFLFCLRKIDSGFEVAHLDLLASRVKSGKLEKAQLLTDLILLLQPKELLVDQKEANAEWLRPIKRYFPNTLLSTRNFGSRTSLEVLEAYVFETQKTDSLKQVFKHPESLSGTLCMSLDSTTLNSLEVIKNIADEKNGPSLLSCIDRTVTPMGRRLLKEWLVAPLFDAGRIQARLDSVDLFWIKPSLRESIRGSLKLVRDLERLASKSSFGLSMPRDLVVVRETLKQIPILKSALGKPKPSRLSEIQVQLDPLKKLVKLLDAALLDEPAAHLREGGIFKDSYRPEIQEFRQLMQDAKSFIENLEERERKKTGISSLKIKYSKVFGFTIEITQSNLSKVPPHYTRKQTISNGERFVTDELKKFEAKIENAESKLIALEETLFLELRQEVAALSSVLLQNARLIAELDVLQSFATVSVEKNYTKPEISSGWDLHIVDGRHPVVEALLPLGEFIPNSIDFSEDYARTWLLTGPNMSGKSTIMRQVALITLLAHTGCFVPAKSANIPLIDSIYTRIGSADDLAHGRSTFMVEMTEMARILNSATERSLILIDEVGRGTSTYDGLSLAMSLLEFIHDSVRAKTLFSTHFHELTTLEKKFPQLRNANVLVRNWNGEIVFLHKLVPGICMKSYGVEVAKLAGLPPKILLRAEKILLQLERHAHKGKDSGSDALTSSDLQLDIFSEELSPQSRASIDAQEN